MSMRAKVKDSSSLLLNHLSTTCGKTGSWASGQVEGAGGRATSQKTLSPGSANRDFFALPCSVMFCRVTQTTCISMGLVASVNSGHPPSTLAILVRPSHCISEAVFEHGVALHPDSAPVTVLPTPSPQHPLGQLECQNAEVD